MSILSAVPPDLSVSLHSAQGAQAAVYALLLNQDEPARGKQLGWLAGHADAETRSRTISLARALADLPSQYRLPILDLAIPALRTLASADYERFRANVEELAVADGQITIFEYAVHHALVRHLDSALRTGKAVPVQYYDLRPLIDHSTKLLSILARFGADEADSAEAAFKQGLGALGGRIEAAIAPPAECTLTAIDEALTALAQASPPLKKRVLAACVVCVAADGMITVDEAELLRAVADGLGCPLPPFLPGKTSIPATPGAGPAAAAAARIPSERVRVAPTDSH